ncbi:PilZ domain-containing protein [Aneurinibacillus tyrosinisolvens]|uniref:PilZ domain-containing protein n=1 Tax=Aneurinibacillus tyrosinisolvens TaxID=1443435 RepID=UPI00069C66B1|nr:PilZ domain-containing protein [Aneurinibacillus tyrosinisolvens]
MDNENNREFFRLAFPHPLVSNVTIIQIKGNAIDSGSTKVLIEDVSFGGLRFISPMKLPVNPHVILEFETIILKQEVQLPGYVVWKKEGQNGLHEYGVRFTIDDSEFPGIIQLFNRLEIRMRRNPLVSDCWFTTESKEQFFNDEPSSVESGK